MIQTDSSTSTTGWAAKTGARTALHAAYEFQTLLLRSLTGVLRDQNYQMMRSNIQSAAIAILCVFILLPSNTYAADAKKARLEKVVALAIRPIMERYGVPGMAVGIVEKRQSHVYDYGTASKATGRAVASNTLFEIGFVSK